MTVEIPDQRDWRVGNSRTPGFVELSRVLTTSNYPDVDPMDDTSRSVTSVALTVGTLVSPTPGLPGRLR